MIDTMGRKRIFILGVVVFLALAFAACGNSKEEKEKKEIKEVAQKYFDALKIGDQEGEYDCYLPTERQKRDAELGLWGAAGKLFLNVDLGEVISDADTLFGGGERVSDQYKYKVADVKLGEDGTEAVAYVDIYEEKEICRSVRINMTKYGGNWYVVRGTVADDDRGLEEAESNDESGPHDHGAVAGNGSNDSDGNMMQAGGIILITAVSITAVVLFILFFRSRRSRKRLPMEIPLAGPLGEMMDPGDILCSCGTVNPVGIRTCMGCGKKLKKRR